MFTEEEKAILIQGLDMQVFSASQQISKLPEPEKVKARAGIDLLHGLVDKVQSIKPNETKPASKS